jgi:hypothetical protein
MVHVHYKGNTKMNYGGMTAFEFSKKNCEVINQQLSVMGKPAKIFKVTGSFKDLESYTEDVYISTENSYHATYRSAHKIKQTDACTIKIIPYQENQIIRYAQRSAYKFNSSHSIGEQWSRSELPGPAVSKVVGGAMAGLWNFKMSRSAKKNMIANLFCEEGGFSMESKREMVGSACVWRARPEDRLQFLGHSLELVLSSNTQMGEGVTVQETSDSVNLREAYDAHVFQVPKEVLNMPFYADQPDYTKPDDGDADLDCKSEKKRTGVDPCSSPAALAKWCKAELEKTGKDRCNNDDMDEESEE